MGRHKKNCLCENCKSKKIEGQKTENLLPELPGKQGLKPESSEKSDKIIQDLPEKQGLEPKKRGRPKKVEQEQQESKKKGNFWDFLK